MRAPSVPHAVPLWFIDTLAYVRVGGEATDGRYTIVENLAREGNMPPLHLHRHEDELFHLLEGRLSVHLPGERVELDAGASLRAPRGIPHTYRVESGTARWLVVCEPAGFDGFVQETSQPAPVEDLPPLDRSHDLEAIAAAAAKRGIELLGPPGAFPRSGHGNGV